MPEPRGTGSSLERAAGARYQVQQRNRGRETEVVRVRFATLEGACVPAGAVSVED